MPSRKVPLATNYIYHIYNRGLNRQPIFRSTKEYARASTALWYYRFQNTPLSLKSYLDLSIDIRNSITEKLEKDDLKHVDLLCYCLMPNHFHLLVKQLSENGISKFLGNFQNSYTRYYNLKNDLQGPLLTPQFKAVLIETDEQLLHVSRYIHLNPYTSVVVKSFSDTLYYQYSSLKAFVDDVSDKLVSSKKIILDLVEGKDKYKKFVLDQADYQRKLKKIKHLVFEEAKSYRIPEVAT